MYVPGMPEDKPEGLTEMAVVAEIHGFVIIIRPLAI